MTPVSAPPISTDRAPRHRRREPPRPGSQGRSRVIRRYEDPSGRVRELIVRKGAGGSMLVIDRDPVTEADERLVAHLAEDEPVANAEVVCDDYLAQDASRRGCRIVTPRDAVERPFPDPVCEDPRQRSGALPTVEAAGHAYRLERVPSRTSIPQLRWTDATSRRATGDLLPVSLRDAIGSLEAYEPLCGLTRRAIARDRDDATVSTTVLRAELTRVLQSPIVLNRGLREAVLARVGREELSMSEIALRCGRVKRDARGNESGETSWLARRIGLLAEGGQASPTPWVHGDVLGLIARHGLGISPREVELV